MPRPGDPASLQRYVRQLRYAVATTTCRATVAVLKQMLSEADARLLGRAPPPAASRAERRQP